MIMTVIMEAITGPEVIALMAMMTANVLLSIIAAISKKKFSFRNLGDFVLTRFLPLVTYVIIAVFAEVVDGWQAATIAVYAGLIAMYGAGIAAAIKSLTGVSIPNVFSEKKS